MVSKCANPSCGTDFKYFRDGRIYEFSVGGEGACKTAVESPGKGAKRELFWLCQDCAQQFTLQCSDGEITVVGRAREAA
jgi:hypothetical protein